MELTVDQALQQGVAAHKEGKLQDAERLYRAILQAQPKHPDANHNLGVLAMAVGKPLEAIPPFKLAVDTNPQIQQFWLSYIDALIKVERFDEAKRALTEGEKSGVSSEKLDSLNQRLQQSAPNDPNKSVKVQTLSEKRKKLAEKKKSKKRKAQGSLSNAAPSEDQLDHLLSHYQANRLEEAEELAELLLQQFPKHPFAWKVLGAVFKQSGRLNKSLQYMQKSAELEPRDAEALNNIGTTLQELGRLDESEASYRQAIALKPNFASAHYSLGVTLRDLGRLDEAEASYRKAIALEPKYAEAHSNLGTTLQEQGRLDEAEASYKQAIAMQPDFADAHYKLGVTRRELGRIHEAEASYRQAIMFKPGFAAAHSNLGNTLQEQGRLDEAEASYRQAIALNSHYAEAHSNLGITLKDLDRLDESEASYKQAIALEPNFASAYYNWGVTLKKRGRLDKAEARYRQAIALDPNHAEAHSNLGDILQELGRLDEAEASYRQAVTLKPEDSSTRHLLAALLGNTTSSAPLDYVETLFDRYAAKFETALVGNLEYKTPKIIAEIILRDSNFDSLGSIIDLGCGTGLLGSEIRQYCEHLEGLDLSQKMLDEASKKSIYDELIKQDILGYLTNASLSFDYFIATDVFVYIGDLSDVFQLIKSRNKTGGKLVFSTEHYDGDDFLLAQSGRYSHSKIYIESLCELFGYTLRHFETQPLRKEKNQYISGGLYILDF